MIDNFDSFPLNYRVALYGSGELGRVVLKKIRESRSDIVIPFFIDSFQEGEKYGVEVVLPYALINARKQDYDFVLITSGYINEISNNLKSIGVLNFGVVSMDFYAHIQLDNLLSLSDNFNLPSDNFSLPSNNFNSLSDNVNASSDNFLSFENNEQIFKSIVIGTNNKCNMMCKFCESNINPNIKDKRTLQSMDFELFKSIINQIEQFNLTKAVDIVGSGEPMLYPHLIDAIKYCKSKHLHVTTFTNGLLLTTDKYKELVSSGLDCLYISLHNLSQESFKYRHKTKDFNSYFQNILNVIDYHVSQDLDSKIIIRLMYASEDEIAVILWDVPYIKQDTQNSLQLFRIFLDSIENIAAKYNKKSLLSEDSFKIAFDSLKKSNTGQLLDIMNNIQLNIMYLVPPSCTNFCNIPNYDKVIKKINFEKHSDNGFCTILDRPVVTYDGSVLPCCGKEEIVIGKIDKIFSANKETFLYKETSLIDIFKGSKYKDMLNGFKSNQLVFEECRKCMGTYTVNGHQFY